MHRQLAALLRQGVRQQRCDSVDRIYGGGRGIGDARQFNNTAQKRFQLQGATLLHVLQHGCFVRTHRLSAGNALVDGHFEGHAQLFTDVLSLQHHALSQFPRERVSANVFQRGVAERTHRVEGQVAPELDPNL